MQFKSIHSFELGYILNCLDGGLRSSTASSKKNFGYRWQTAPCICVNAMAWHAGEPPKTRPSPYVLPCRIWPFCVKRCGHIHVRTGETPKIRERWNSTLLGWEAWLATRHKPLPHVCYHVKFGSSTTKGVHLNKMEPPNWGAVGPCAFGVGEWLTTSISINFVQKYNNTGNRK